MIQFYFLYQMISNIKMAQSGKEKTSEYLEGLLLKLHNKLVVVIVHQLQIVSKNLPELVRYH